MLDSEMSPVSFNRPDLFSAESVGPMSEASLERLYSWVDTIPLSRPKKNIARDFADGVLAAEVVRHFLPNIVEMHNYPASSSTKAKEHNWYHLNRKVLSRVGLELDADVIRKLVTCQPMVIECLLVVLRRKLEQTTGVQSGSDYITREAKLLPLQPLSAVEHDTRPSRKQWSSDQQSLPSAWPDDRPEADQQWRKRGLIPISNPTKNHSPREFPELKNSNQTGLLPSPKGLPSNGAMKMSEYQSGRSPLRKQNKQAELAPKTLLKQKEEELSVAHQTVEMLQSKIQKLEQLIQLKDLRIDDLTYRIDSLQQHQMLKGGTKKPTRNKYGK